MINVVLDFILQLLDRISIVNKDQKHSKYLIKTYY